MPASENRTKGQGHMTAPCHADWPCATGSCQIRKRLQQSRETAVKAVYESKDTAVSIGHFHNHNQTLSQCSHTTGYFPLGKLPCLPCFASTDHYPTGQKATVTEEEERIYPQHFYTTVKWPRTLSGLNCAGFYFLCQSYIVCFPESFIFDKNMRGRSFCTGFFYLHGYLWGWFKKGGQDEIQKYFQFRKHNCLKSGVWRIRFRSENTSKRRQIRITFCSLCRTGMQLSNDGRNNTKQQH